MKEIFKIAVSLENSIQYQLLERFNLKKTLRILSWVQRFTINCNIKERKKRSKGPLTTKEIDLQLTKMILDNQSRSELYPAFSEIKEALNLNKKKQGLYECCGKIIGDDPIFVPRKTLLAEKMVLDTESETTKKKDYMGMPWMLEIPCNCIYSSHIRPTTARQKTNGHRSLQGIALDFAGPIIYKGRKDSLKQAYILLITCSLS